LGCISNLFFGILAILGIISEFIGYKFWHRIISAGQGLKDFVYNSMGRR
jgi:hypothetical protein